MPTPAARCWRPRPRTPIIPTSATISHCSRRVFAAARPSSSSARDWRRRQAAGEAARVASGLCGVGPSPERWAQRMPAGHSCSKSSRNSFPISPMAKLIESICRQRLSPFGGGALDPRRSGRRRYLRSRARTAACGHQAVVRSRRGGDRRIGAQSDRGRGKSIDLYHFTSLLGRKLDEDGRRRVIEMMWEIVYADGRVSEFEDNLIWRAADLLGVSTRERVELRQRVAASRGHDV